MAAYGLNPSPIPDRSARWAPTEKSGAKCTVRGKKRAYKLKQNRPLPNGVAGFVKRLSLQEIYAILTKFLQNLIDFTELFTSIRLTADKYLLTTAGKNGIIYDT